MKKYRIKIIERNNGDKEFIPQFLLDDKWLNIVYFFNPVLCYRIKTIVDLEDKFEQLCPNEGEALEIIEKHKFQLINEFNKEIKSETFKEIL